MTAKGFMARLEEPGVIGTPEYAAVYALLVEAADDASGSDDEQLEELDEACVDVRNWVRLIRRRIARAAQHKKEGRSWLSGKSCP